MRFCTERAAQRYRGCSPCREAAPAIGRLFFVRRDRATPKELWNAPLLPVLTQGETLSPDLAEAAVGIIFCGAEEAPALPQGLPLLILPSLSEETDGSLALLEPTRQQLTVHPELEDLFGYSQAHRRHTAPTDPHGRPLGFWAPWDTESHILPFAPSAYLIRIPPAMDEASCFDLLCSLDTPSRAIPFVVCLSAAGRTYEELISCIRGIYRSAVYTRLSLLLEGISDPDGTSALLSLCHQAFCELSEEAREFNGYLPKGIRLDTPLLAFECPLPRGVDFFCLDVERIRTLLCGKKKEARSPALERALDALLARRMHELGGNLYAEALPSELTDPPAWLSCSALKGIAQRE